MLRGVLLAGTTLGLLPGLTACRRTPPAPPAEPFGPIRANREIRQAAPTLVGQVVRLRGRITSVRDLNSGLSFPWDVVYTVDDGTDTVPVHWFTQQQSPKERKLPTLAGNTVIVTGKVKRNVDLNGKIYPLLIHEIAELHNQEKPALPVALPAR